MAGSSHLQTEDDEGIIGINVTPLVDVMLVLLIIFMVTANYISHQAISLNLPKAETGGDATENNLHFTLTKDSTLSLDKEIIDFKDLANIIKNKLDSTTIPKVLISADRATPHGTVIKLIDVVKKNGITDIAFNVEFDPSNAE